MFTLLAAILAGTPAHACGGFFCSSGGPTTTTTTTTETLTGGYGTVPVVQDAERILFRINDDDTITTFVEVGFQQREDVDFAWIIPIPDVIDVDEVTTADAGLFNELEMATAPSFTFQWQEQNVVNSYNYNYGYYGYGRPGGCSTMGCSAESSMDAKTGGFDTGLATTTQSVEEQASVEVLQDAVVGPFAIEVIQATDALDFATWLETNAYDLPEGAIEPLEHYIDQGMSFLGVKLAPDVPEGPIDTLVFSCPAEAPTIPLILTSIASADRLGITAYVLGEDPHVPTNWALTRDFSQETTPIGGGQTDYLLRAEAEISVHDGQAFVLEYAGDTEDLYFGDLLINATVKQYPKLVRYRGSIAPWQMTLDPEFGPFPGFPDFGRDHFIDLGIQAAGPTYRTAGRSEVRRRFRGKGAWLIVAPLALLGWLRRRNRDA